MMKTFSLLLLLSFSFAVFAENEEGDAFHWTWIDFVNNRTTLVKTLEVPTLGTPLMVSSTVGTSLCVLANVQPSKVPSKWSKSCLFFYNFTSDTPTISKMSRRARRLHIKETSFNPIPGKYYVAIASEFNVDFTVAMSAVKCVPPSFGHGCSQNGTDPIPQNKTIIYEAGNSFLFNLPEEVSRIRIVAQRIHSTDRVAFSLRGGNAALVNTSADLLYTLSDDTSHDFTVDNPLPGLWYGSLSLPASSVLKGLVSGDAAPKVAFYYWYDVCHNQTGHCWPVNELNLHSNQALIFSSQSGQLIYFKTKLEGAAFNMSVQNQDDSSDAPVLLARFEQLPRYSTDATIRSSFDALSAGNTVNFLTLDEYEPGTWYFAVVGTGKSFALWFNNTCPSQCASNGACVKKGDVFVCQCNDGYEGFDCAVKTESGFKTEYIVLIVIGSIIALAALLGLLVYLYNRNRHPGGGYEKI